MSLASATWTGAYVLFVVACGLLIYSRNQTSYGVPTRRITISEERMETNSTLNWSIKLSGVRIPANPEGRWTCVYDYLPGSALIRIAVQRTGDDKAMEWNYSERNSCSADGDPSATLQPRDCILSTAPVGSLLAKIGGSTAGTSDGKVFLVGSFSVFEIDSATKGPLFLTINDDPAGFENNAGALLVDISICPVKTNSTSQPPGSPPGGVGAASPPAALIAPTVPGANGVH